MTAQIYHLRDYKTKAERESVLVIPENGDPSYEIPMPVVDAHFAPIADETTSFPINLSGREFVEPPADCPA